MHVVKNKPHWMDRVDSEALGWVINFERNPFPKKVVWHLNNDQRQSFYNLFLVGGEFLLTNQLEVLKKNQNK